MSSINTVTVTETQNSVSVTADSKIVTVTQPENTVSVYTPFVKTGTDQLIFQTFTDGSTNAVPDSGTDTFTFEGTAPITATVNESDDKLTVAVTDATNSAKGVASFSSSDFAVNSGAVSLVDITTTHIADATLVTDTDDIANNDNNTTIPTSGAVKDYVDTHDANIGSDTLTFTNKTFDADATGNSLSNVDVPDFKSGVIVTESVSIASNDNDTTIPTSASVKDYVDTQDANIASDTLTFTNKTFDVEATGNSISNIDVADLKSGVLDTDISSTSSSHDTLPSAKATKAYVDSAVTQATTSAQGVGTGDSPTFVNQTLTGSLRGPATFTIDPATVGDNTGTLVVAGNLQVDGTTTTVNSTTLTVDDKNIELGSVANPSDTTADGGGITLKGATDKTLLWDNTNDNWSFSEHANVATGKEYKVNNASVLNATTLGSSVVNSSLTSVGTIGTGQWQGTRISTTYLDASVATVDDATALSIALG